MNPTDTAARRARIHVVAEGVLASYIHELSAAAERAVASVTVPAQSPNGGMEAA